MIRVWNWVLVLLGLACVPAGAFSLLGPFKGATSGFQGEPWQDRGYAGRPAGLGYTLAFDIGGPMFAHEAYRWNIPVVTYAFDSSFLRFFGSSGVDAIEQVIAIFNALPPASQMSATLDEFPLDAKGQNGEAAALGLLDIKSFAMAALLEEMGLANPERFVFGIRGRFTTQFTTNYSVVQMNYDPQTIQPTRYVNGVLYNFLTLDAIGPMGGEWASAVEWYQLDPLRLPYSSIAGSLGSGDLVLGDSPSTTGGVAPVLAQGLAGGQYFTGFTRDDLGGLRYLLSTNNYIYETLLPTIVPSTTLRASSPWAPVISTNIAGSSNGAPINLTGTNILANFARTALRPGVDKITFQRVNFDSVLGTTFTPITNRYTDRFINPTNGRTVKQQVSRVILRPDIIFAAGDIGTVQALPFSFSRTDTTGWSNNAALNASAQQFAIGLGGPGVITPGIEITFNDLFPYFFSIPDGTDADFPFVTTWGSFDGTTRPPTVYPIFQHPLVPELSLEYLRSLVARKKK